MTTPELTSLLLRAILSQSTLTSFLSEYSEQKPHEMDFIPDSPSAMSDYEDIPHTPEKVDADGIPMSPVLKPIPPCHEFLLPMDDDFVL